MPLAWWNSTATAAQSAAPSSACVVVLAIAVTITKKSRVRVKKKRYYQLLNRRVGTNSHKQKAEGGAYLAELEGQQFGPGHSCLVPLGHRLEPNAPVMANTARPVSRSNCLLWAPSRAQCTWQTGARAAQPVVLAK